MGLFGGRRSRRREDVATGGTSAPPLATDTVDAAASPRASAGPAPTITQRRTPDEGTGSADDLSSDPALASTEGVWTVIRPAAIVPEHAARRILVELARRDLGNGGEWECEPQLWSRFDGPASPDASAAQPELMGTIHVTYGTPTKYEITVYRVSITPAGFAGGWSVATLTDEALGFGGLTLAQCPRAVVQAPPKPFTY